MAAISPANESFLKSRKKEKKDEEVGKVMIPQSAFLSVLKTDTD
jgi:translation elongation factor EF-4